MKRLLVLMVVALLALTSCTAFAEGTEYEVTLILKDNTSAGWRYLAAAAIATGNEIGVKVTENSPLETQDADEQYNAVLNAIEMEVDAIVIAPVDSAGIVPAIEEAVEAGIPVFTTNTNAFVNNEDDIVSFVGVGNEQGGYDIAKYMFSQFGEDETINLIIVDGNRTGQTTLDKEVFETLAGRDVTLEVSVPGGVTWTVNGQDIPRNAALTDIDMGVSMGTSTIPVSIINAVTGEVSTVQFTLAHDGPFGFTMTLTAPLGAENAGLWANLYYYDEDSRALEFQAASRIGADGTASFPFSHASGYAIVIDTVSHEPVELPFTDVPEDAWYADAAAYVYRHGLMNGVSSTVFAPDTTTSRAMIATILWRMAGSPVVNYAMDYTDVAQGQWCSEAIRWATSEGIVTGYGDGLFGTNDPITRQQFAAMLWRYAQAQGYDVSIGEDTNILSYTDAFDVAEYAIPAIQWAVGAGIVNGTSADTLTPQGRATRAQAAVMLMRFCQRYTDSAE